MPNTRRNGRKSFPVYNLKLFSSESRCKLMPIPFVYRMCLNSR
jgi:hypothetical protein